MKTSFSLTFKYWNKHLKNALALLFSGMLTAAVITFVLLTIRENFNRDVQRHYDESGMHHVSMAYDDDELFNRVAEGKSGYSRATMYVYGTVGNPEDDFRYGTVEGDIDMLRIPMEAGRLPRQDNEAAIDRNVLDSLHWVGKVGDTISFNNRTFTVVGIIEDIYGNSRAGSPLLTIYVNEDEMEIKPYHIPLIYIGKSDEEPVYKIDYLDNFFTEDMSEEELSAEANRCIDIVSSAEGGSKEKGKKQWINLFYGTEWIENVKHDPINGKNTFAVTFFLILSGIGAIISVLSVFSVLRTIFIERRGRINILKRIGMSRRKIVWMYAGECAAFTAAQTLLGFISGTVLYVIVYLFKCLVLGYKWYSGLTINHIVTSNTRSPFLFAAAFSVVIMVVAYTITCLTTKQKQKSPQKERKPRSLSGCCSRIFNQGGVAVIQTISLVLICIGTAWGYMYYTDNGKSTESGTGNFYVPPDYNVNGFNMDENGIAEYYAAPPISSFAVNSGTAFNISDADYNAGIDDSTADLYPEYAMATGRMENTYLVFEEADSKYSLRINLRPSEKEFIMSSSSDEYKSFFDDGQLGSKFFYRCNTKLTRAVTIQSLSQYVIEGEINIEKLNSGEEVLMVGESAGLPFTAGETLQIAKVSGHIDLYDISMVESADVIIGAILRLPEDMDPILNYIIRSDNRYAEVLGVSPYNILTTASGAAAMGLSNAVYTEIYSFDKIDGGLIPFDAEMTFTSLAELKTEGFINKAAQYSGTALLLIVMSLLGFAAYFNGIGMKIRLKTYDISVMRAIGMPISMIQKKLLLSGLKIPLISCAISYCTLKMLQAAANYGLQLSVEAEVELNDWELHRQIIETFFLYQNWWQVNAELPVLVLFIVISIVTILLTRTAIKKFKSSISENLSEGRTRQ